jgi:hypothetical protein
MNRKANFTIHTQSDGYTTITLESNDMAISITQHTPTYNKNDDPIVIKDTIDLYDLTSIRSLRDALTRVLDMYQE